MDTVASLGGVPFYMDQLKVDAVYTGSQKVIGAPPGLAPISFGPRAVYVHNIICIFLMKQKKNERKSILFVLCTCLLESMQFFDMIDYFYSEKIKTRPTPIKSYMLDMNQLTIQWQCNDPSIPRIYHHTPPTSLFFALREALAELVEEGIENVWKRHADASQKLHAGLKSLGLKLFVPDPSDRLPTVTTILVPEGIDWKLVTQYANDK